MLLAPFSDKAHAYAAKRLEDDGVTLHLGHVKEVFPDRVMLSDGDTILTHTVVWGGGEKPADVIGAALPQGHGGRIDVEPDLTVADYPQVYVLGDAANIAGADGKTLPQLGSVAEQSGAWAASNILDDIAGKPRKPFRYKDKGIMAMIGRNAAVAEMGASARGRRPGGLRSMAGRSCDVAQRRTKQDRRVHCVGLGLLQQEPRDGDGECTRCRPYRLGR